ncbi:9400_t:CDS:1, partial [Cetraspora pellucida]
LTDIELQEAVNISAVAKVITSKKDLLNLEEILENSEYAQDILHISEIIDLSQYNLENKMHTINSTDFGNMNYSSKELVYDFLTEESV